MPKQKSNAQIYVADGSTGMRTVADLRFEGGEWPIELGIPGKDAESWMAHLNAEIEERGWSWSTLSQLDATENSGTITVHATKGPSAPSLDIIWERLRGKDLRLRARPGGNPVLSLEVARDFINATRARQRSGTTAKARRQAILAYQGLPWRGELWLDSDHRLGPPSKFSDVLLGPQVLITDAMVEGIGQHGITANFQTYLSQLRVFLGLVVGLNLRMQKFESDWVCDIDAAGRITDCVLRPIGYAEMSPPGDFPVPCSAPPIARRTVTRPGLGLLGISPGVHEQWVPADIEKLWDTFIQLPSSRREQLLRAGNAYLIANSLWPDQRTAYVAFLVVACEALKPVGRRYDRMNVYDVVASLLSVDTALVLRQQSFHPQKVRNEHLHRGKLSAGELLPMLMNDYFMDPSFDLMLRNLTTVCRVCLIEWLRCQGNFKVILLPRDKQKVDSSMMQSVATVLRHWPRALRSCKTRESQR